MLLRLAYLTVTNTFAMMRLVPMSDGDKDTEISGAASSARDTGTSAERAEGAVHRAFLAAWLHRLTPEALRGMRLLVRPETVLRWHRDLVRRRHAARSRPKRPGRPPTVRSIRKQGRRIDPAPQRASGTWASFLRSQSDALLACDFLETVTPDWGAPVRAGRDRAPHPPDPRPGRDRPSNGRVGDAGRKEPGHGPGGRRVPCAVADPGP
ncbi:hypothetical protein GCM10009727_71920 [Actinomadura napierensis]|uniref:Integrase n=1 Tax=Actinomadura napierensis TaxID=267854 RepID=A0ABP5M2M0_9ACTN